MIYKKIMVAVDESDVSVQALKEAIRLAKDQKAKLLIVHVIDDLYEGDVDREMYMANLREEGEKILKSMEKLVNRSKVSFEMKLTRLTKSVESFAEQIVKEAKSWSADIIVIGTHGRQGLNYVLVGSLSVDVSRIAPMPVLLVNGF